MKKIMFDKFQEVIDLIPQIQEAGFKGLERDMNIYEFNPTQMQAKLNLFRQMFTMIQGKWSIDICFSLLIYDVCSFNELKRALQGISTRTLTDRLRLLEKFRVITRTVQTESPLRVNYQLSDFGKEEIILFIPALVNFILPPRYKKKFANINEIQKSAKKFVNLGSSKEIDSEYASNIDQKIP